MIYETKPHIFTLIENARYEEAIQALLGSKTLLFPKAQTYFLVGECYRLIGAYENAKLFLEVAYQLKSDAEHIAFALARIYMLLHRYDEAYALFIKLRRHNATNGHIRLRLGMLLLRKGRIKAAVGCLRGLLKEVKNGHIVLPQTPYGLPQPTEETTSMRLFSAIVYNALGEAMLQLGDIKQAAALFWEAILSKPLGSPFFEPYRNLDRVEEDAKHALKRIVNSAAIG